MCGSHSYLSGHTSNRESIHISIIWAVPVGTCWDSEFKHWTELEEINCNPWEYSKFVIQGKRVPAKSPDCQHASYNPNFRLAKEFANFWCQ